MPLRKAPYWTDLYYRVVEHYFWRPQAIGRRADPEKKRRSWRYWEQKLESQETPLNHILDLFFHIVPEELLDRVVSVLLGRKIDNLEIVLPEPGSVDYNIVQPDIIVSNGRELVFVEMKVDSQSSIDQFTKYAIAANYLVDSDPGIVSVDLVVLSRHTDYDQVWKNSKKLGLTSEEKLRRVAISGVKGDHSLWSERGVRRFLINNPGDVLRLADRLQTMGLHLVDYSPIERVLKDYAKKEVAVHRLIQGVLEEFSRRNLVPM